MDRKTEVQNMDGKAEVQHVDSKNEDHPDDHDEDHDEARKRANALAKHWSGASVPNFAQAAFFEQCFREVQQIIQHGAKNEANMEPKSMFDRSSNHPFWGAAKTSPKVLQIVPQKRLPVWFSNHSLF